MRTCESANDMFSIPIERINLDVESRDDIPPILLGLQHLYTQDHLREQVMAWLKQEVAPDRDHNNGRPGLKLWQILVLATLKQGLDCDYARLQELANEHRSLRLMLQHSDGDLTFYRERTLKNNVDLLPESLLEKISDLVAEEGLAISKKPRGDDYVARVDSFVVESNVHHPTDINLLWDAIRASVKKGSRLAQACGVKGWRQWRHCLKKGRKLYQRVSRASLWHRRPDGVKAYLRWCRQMRERMLATVRELEVAGCPQRHVIQLRQWLNDAVRLDDQIRRRVLQGKRIPSAEKIYSIFERYTRWISKGKAGRPVELGVPLSIMESSNGFILGSQLHWEESDVDVAVPLVASVLSRHPKVERCSFDRGYHSPENQLKLSEMLERVVLPVKGHPSQAAKERESTDEFIEARRQHPAVESKIHALETHGLARVRNRGKERFEQTVAISILATNLHRLGRLLQQRAQAQQKRYRLAA